MLENKEGRYFHVTPKENIGQIMSNGLIPAIGPRSEEANEDVALVYMFSNVSDMETALANWLGECFEEDEDELYILQIDLPKHFPIMKTKDTNGDDFFEVTTDKVIPREYITVVYDEYYNIIQGV